MKNIKRTAMIVGLLILLVASPTIFLSYGAITNGNTLAIVIGKSFVNANSTMIQYQYTVVYMNSQIPSSTNTETVNFLVNQTLPVNAAGFSNTVISDIQTHVTKLPFVIPQPSTGNVMIPP